MEGFVKNVGMDLSRPSLYRKIAKRGLEKLIIQNKYNPYDIMYNSIRNNYSVHHKDTDMILKEFDADLPSKSHKSLKSRSFKDYIKLIYKLVFEPELWTNKGLRNASNYARELYQQDLAKNPITKEQRIIEDVEILFE